MYSYVLLKWKTRTNITKFSPPPPSPSPPPVHLPLLLIEERNPFWVFIRFLSLNLSKSVLSHSGLSDIYSGISFWWDPVLSEDGPWGAKSPETRSRRRSVPFPRFHRPLHRIVSAWRGKISSRQGVFTIPSVFTFDVYLEIWTIIDIIFFCQSWLN